MLLSPKRVLDFLVPQRCECCGRPGGGEAMCKECRARVPRPTSPLCAVCGLPFAGTGTDHPCGGCLRRRPAFNQARACTVYRPAAHRRHLPVVDMVKRFKYGPDVTLARPLAMVMQERCPLTGPYDVALPVPLHIDRLRRRGFNQSALLAAPLARRLGIVCDPFALVRLRPTLPQVGLDEPRRRRNLAGAFSIRRPDAVAGRAILLVDDVYTTGSTVDECTRTLLRGGARSVDVVTLARAVLG